MVRAMSFDLHREERGTYLIEAGALDLGQGSHWKPWVKLALLSRADGAFASRTFDGLKPVFGTREAALRYAIELARSLVDEGFPLCPVSDDRKPPKWPMNPALGEARGHRPRKGPASGRFHCATSMIGAFAGILARKASAANICSGRQVELYLSASANHVELERRTHEIERSVVPPAVTISHWAV